MVGRTSHGVVKVFLDILQQHGAAVRVNCIDFGFRDEVDELVGSVFANKRIDGFALWKHDGLEVHVQLFRHLEVLLDPQFLFPAILFATHDDRERFGTASLELVQVIDVQFLEHRRDNAWNAGEVCGERIEESLHDNRVFTVGLDVERDDCRTRSIRNVRVALFVVVDEPSIDGVDESLGVAGRNRQSRLVVRFEVVQVKTDLVAFDTGKHAVADERFRVAAVIAETIQLGLPDAPAAGFQEFCRRRAFASGPVAVTHEAFQHFGFFAADFLDPRMFAFLVACQILVEGA